MRTRIGKIEFIQIAEKASPISMTHAHAHPQTPSDPLALVHPSSPLHHTFLLPRSPFETMPPRDEDVRNGRKGKLASPGNTGTSILESAQRFWQRSYAGDYLGLAIIIVLWVPLKVFGEPYHQMFRLSDSRIQHPHAEVERVGVSTLYTTYRGSSFVSFNTSKAQVTNQDLDQQQPSSSSPRPSPSSSSPASPSSRPKTATKPTPPSSASQ